MSLFSCGFHEAHFSGLLGQSNVYGLSNVVLPDSTIKVLVSPLREKVLCVEYIREKGNLKPVSREVQFGNIPDDAEIVSMDAFSKLGESGGFVVGITVAKLQDMNKNKPSHYFNMYCPWEKDSAFNLESVAHSWSSMELDFIPYYLTHTRIACCGDTDLETVFLLSGNDKRVHLYKEEKELSINRFMEQSAEKVLPEFNELPSIALWIDIQHNEQHERITAVGCQNGFLRVAVVSLKSNEITHKWELRHDGPITCVKLFQSQMPSKVPPFCNLEQLRDDRCMDESSAKPPYHLLVTSALEIAVVYRDASVAGFEKHYVLPDSDLYDCALCACIADVDWDGHNEILIGTYGQEALAYKYYAGSTKETASPPEVTDEKTVTCNIVDSGPELPGEYRLHWKRSFSQPIVAMQYVDITGDGLRELVVVTVRGIHVLQHDLHEAATRCLNHLKSITKLGDKEEGSMTTVSLEKHSDMHKGGTQSDARTVVEGAAKSKETGGSTKVALSAQCQKDALTTRGDEVPLKGNTVATLKEIAKSAAGFQQAAADQAPLAMLQKMALKGNTGKV